VHGRETQLEIVTAQMHSVTGRQSRTEKHISYKRRCAT
jgi:hypothetical protein